ncbi:MAG: tetratricopeptide repeat protein [Candidatus Edwardsbacteria bacterium]|nr:tetratricopeptide repeat protein [Candidatus Edwardsbacteria bacterium]
MTKLSKNTKIGTKYQILEFLGQGANSQVYKATDLATGATLALKLFSGDSININQLCQEFRCLSDLSHPNLARAIGYEHYKDGCFFAMEFLPGPDILESCRGLDLRGKCQKLIGLCQALEYIHSRDVIHLDLKPSNLLLDESGTVKLLDFGLAQSTVKVSPLKISGTPSYISPEIISGQAPDGRADLYSLGVLMYQIFTGSLPFQAPTIKELVKKHLYHQPQPPNFIDQSLPERLSLLILRLLSKDPNARPALADEVASELAGIIKLERAEPSPVSRPPFILNCRMAGRDREMNQLRQAVQNAIAGQGHSIFISGETGIGRTKLLTEFSLHSQLLECQVLWARCYQPDAAAFGLMVQLLDQVQSLARNFCPQALAEFGPQLAEIIPGLSDLPEVNNLPPPPVLPAQEQRLRLLDAMTNFIIKTLEASPSRATAIILESIQWIDRESLEALCHLVRNIGRAPVLVVGSFRSDEIESGHFLRATIESLASDNLAEQVFLKRLSRNEVSELIRTVFPSLENLEPLLVKIYGETDGNPLLIEETLYYLIDAGFIVRRHGRWQITTLTPERLDLPGSLTLSFRAKLGKLPPGQLLIMQSLAIMERPAIFPEIRSLTEMEDVQLSRDLLHLKGQSLLAWLQDEKGEPAYGLHHFKIVPEIGLTISRELSSALHRRAALVMEQQRSRSLQDTVLLSSHWEAAGEPAKAAECHLRAGDELSEFSKRQAIEHYRRALVLVPSPRNIPVLEKVQKLYYVSGEYQKALEQALEICQLQGSSPEICYKIGRCQERLGDYDRSVESLQKGLSFSQGDALSAARLMGALAITSIGRGEYRNAEKTCQAALKQLPLNSRPTVEAELYNTLGQAYWHLAEWSQALSVHRRSLEIKEREGSLYGIATSYNNLGAVYYRMYEWDKAAECHKKSFSLREKIGDISGLARSYNNLALIYRHLYDWERALEYHGKCLQTMERIGLGLETAASLVDIGLIHKAKGEWDQALWSYNRAIQLAANIGAKNLLLDAYIRKAELYLALGSLEDSSLFCQKSLAMASELGGRLELGRGLNISGRISQMRQQWDKAREDLTSAREIFSGLDIKAGEAYILKNLADLHRELGQLEESSALADRSLSLAQRVEEQQLVSEVLLLKGELLEEKGLDGYRFMEWSLEIANQVKISETTWPVYSAMARRHLKNKKYPAALECCQKALLLFKQSLANISQPELKTSYILAPRRRQLFRDIKSLSQEVLNHAG